MKFSAYRTAIALIFFSAFLLSGCGGGSGGSSTTLAPDRNATINSANADMVSAQAYWALTFLNEQINSSIGIVEKVTDADLSSKYCSTDNGVTIKGSRKLKVDTVNNIVTVTDDHCDNGFWTSNSTTIVKLSNLAGVNPINDGASPWQGTLTISLNIQLNANFYSQTEQQNCDLVVEYDHNYTTPNVDTFHVTNASLEWQHIEGSSTVDRKISNANYTGSIDAFGLNTLNANFSLSGNFGKLGTPRYDISTKTDFKRQIASDQTLGTPTQGTMTVTAPDKSTLIFAAVDATNARRDVDWNGDNVIDSGNTVSWDTLGHWGNAFYLLN